MLTEFEKYGILTAENVKCMEEEFPFCFVVESAW